MIKITKKNEFRQKLYLIYWEKPTIYIVTVKITG